MRTPSLEPLAPWLAAAGAGGVVALAVQLSTSMFAAGPVAASVGAAAGLAYLAPAGVRRRTRSVLAVIAAGLTVASDPLARAAVWLGGYSTLPLAAAGLGALIATGLFAPMAVAAARATRGPRILGVACFVGGAWLDPRALLALVLLAGGGAALGEGPAPMPTHAPWGHRGLRLFAAAALGSVVLGAWAIGRSALDPTPLGFVALSGGIALGATLFRSPAPAVLGGALAAATAYAAATHLPELLAAHAYSGTAIVALFGLAAGPLFGALRLDRANAAVALGAAALALPPLLGALPDELAARAAQADAATASTLERAAALRDRTTLVWAGVGPTGAAAVRRLENRVFTELEGGLFDPETRAGAAERFAGTLASCAANGRTRARVAGDDLGLAVDALRAQGFLAIDTALPDGALVRAQAAQDPVLARSWLHPSVRIVTLPGPALLRAGPAADAVVQILRAPLSDGHQIWPDRAALAAVRAGLAPDGAYVLAVATTALGAPALRALLADLTAVFPSGSLWLPPEGADTALFVGPARASALPWAGFERCVAADSKGLAAQAIRSALDIGTLALADATSLRAAPPGRAAAFGLPASLREPPSLPLADYASASADPTLLFSGAPEADLTARAPSRKLLLDMLREATSGDVRDAFTRARALAETPGGARALEPVLRPHLIRARQAMQRGRKEGITSKAWEEAEAAIGTARALAPNHAGTRCLEGELAGERGQLARAEESFAACAELDPTSLAGLEGLARSRRSRGDLLGTEAALRAALDARPEVWTTSQRLGAFLLELGRDAEAERLLKQAAATQARSGGPQEVVPYLALAQLYLATDRPELALAQAQRATTMKESADALALRGSARFALRQIEDAEADFRAALKLDPAHVLGRGGMGLVHATRGEYELAAAAFQAVLVKDPDNALARKNLDQLGPMLRAAQAP